MFVGRRGCPQTVHCDKHLRSKLPVRQSAIRIKKRMRICVHTTADTLHGRQVSSLQSTYLCRQRVDEDRRAVVVAEDNLLPPQQWFLAELWKHTLGRTAWSGSPYLIFDILFGQNNPHRILRYLLLRVCSFRVMAVVVSIVSLRNDSMNLIHSSYERSFVLWLSCLLLQMR